MSQYLRVMIGVTVVLLASAVAYALAHDTRKAWTPCTTKQVEGLAVLLGLVLPLVCLLLAQFAAIGRLGVAVDEPRFGGVVFFAMAMAFYNLTRRAVWALFANAHAVQWLRIDGPGQLSVRNSDGTERAIDLTRASVTKVSHAGALPYLAYSFEHMAQRYAFIVGMEKLAARPATDTANAPPQELFARGKQKELRAMFEAAVAAPAK